MSPTTIVALTLLAMLATIAGRAQGTRFAAGDEQLIDPERRLYVAYIVEEGDILVKKACNCLPRRHCLHTDNVQLTDDKCSNPNTCCVTAGVDLDNY